MYIYQYTYVRLYTRASEKLRYGVAKISRLLTIIGLFCRMWSLLQGSFAKETYNLKEPTNHSHPIPAQSTPFSNTNQRTCTLSHTHNPHIPPPTHIHTHLAETNVLWLSRYRHSRLHCNTLQHAATHCNTLHHTATHFATLQNQCNMPQHTATHCTKPHHTTIHYNTLHHTAPHYNLCTTLQHTAPHNNTLHHTAPRCKTLHHTAPHHTTHKPT